VEALMALLQCLERRGNGGADGCYAQRGEEVGYGCIAQRGGENKVMMAVLLKKENKCRYLWLLCPERRKSGDTNS